MTTDLFVGADWPPQLERAVVLSCDARSPAASNAGVMRSARSNSSSARRRSPANSACTPRPYALRDARFVAGRDSMRARSAGVNVTPRASNKRKATAFSAARTSARGARASIACSSTPLSTSAMRADNRSSPLGIVSIVPSTSLRALSNCPTRGALVESTRPDFVRSSSRNTSPSRERSTSCNCELRERSVTSRSASA